MAVVSAHDIAKPFDPDGQPYAVFGNRVPALRGFRLTYDDGGDREVATLGVLAGGMSQDLTPAAPAGGLGNGVPADIPDGRLEVYLQDADPSEDEFGYDVSHSTLKIPGARRYQIRQVGNVGAVVRKLPSIVSGDAFPPQASTPLLALAGFRLNFRGNRSRELDRIGIWFRDNDLHVVMKDQNVNPLTDTYDFLVDFVVIPTFNLSVDADSRRGSARAFETVELPTPARSHFVLTGWALNFQNGDHEILDIGVLRSQSAFTVFYGDSGGGDPFDWRVEWAHVSPRVFAPAATLATERRS
jgi:hypothetical protein